MIKRIQKSLLHILTASIALGFVFHCCHSSMATGQEHHGNHHSPSAIAEETGKSLFQTNGACQHTEPIEAITPSLTQKDALYLTLNPEANNISLASSAPTIERVFTIITRTTGPPWHEKHIKGVLGIYRS